MAKGWKKHKYRDLNHLKSLTGNKLYGVTLRFDGGRSAEFAAWSQERTNFISRMDKQGSWSASWTTHYDRSKPYEYILMVYYFENSDDALYFKLSFSEDVTS